MFDLFAELKSYLPYDYEEAESKRKFFNFLSEHSNCYSRKNFYGHITAGGFVCDGKGNILLNHHKALNMWFQFGGHCDDNTNVLEVAKREILEETSLTDFRLAKEGIFDVACVKNPGSVKKNEPAHYHFDVNFLFISNTRDFKISNESTEIKWVTIEEARKLIDKNDYSMLRMVDKYEQYLKNNLCSNQK